MEEKVINNIDDISFSINTDNKNDNKKTNYKKIHINRREDSKNDKTSDNCYIYLNYELYIFIYFVFLNIITVAFFSINISLYK